MKLAAFDVETRGVDVGYGLLYVNGRIA